MRIISGKYGRRRFTVPKNFKLRPTTDLAKEALFNTLAAEYDLEDIHVLDLFAGTGSVGIEFLSRGASKLVSVEQQERHCAFIKQVIKELDPDAPATVIRGNVKSFLQSSTSDKYDMIFADPPYALEWLDEIPLLVKNSGLLAEGGLFILEHPSDYDFSQSEGFHKHKSYSAVNYSFFLF